MASIDVYNNSEGWLVLWLEPLGEDRWLRPRERFTVHTAYEGSKTPFEIEFWVSERDRAAGIENVNCWVNEGNAYAEVRDQSGALVECGHQRPADVDARWTAQLEELEKRQRDEPHGG
ncbi:hypothetical protein [Nocardioides nitrophenolicus]|uniref:hypothetical protein n=1 Tax=Nocardioides nitrophenolicus TaxID=60489 RepID=UPI000B2D9123|nr:hypothetical protein [Nocardioides nitrophenolicus]MBM7515715.1 hypothetical protein [Nocardioides nitrophenolicus]